MAQFINSKETIVQQALDGLVATSGGALARLDGYSTVASLMAILMGAVIIVPTVYWVRLKVPKLRPVIEFISLLPLIVPPVVLVFG